MDNFFPQLLCFTSLYTEKGWDFFMIPDSKIFLKDWAFSFQNLLAGFYKVATLPVLSKVKLLR